MRLKHLTDKRVSFDYASISSQLTQILKNSDASKLHSLKKPNLVLDNKTITIYVHTHLNVDKALPSNI